MVKTISRRKIITIFLLVSIPLSSFVITLYFLGFFSNIDLKVIEYSSKYGSAKVFTNQKGKIEKLEISGAKDSPIAKSINEAKNLSLPGLEIKTSENNPQIIFNKKLFNKNAYYEELKKFGYQEKLEKAKSNLGKYDEYEKTLRLGRQIFEPEKNIDYRHYKTYSPIEFSDDVSILPDAGLNCMIDFCFEISNASYPGDESKKLLYTYAFESDHPAAKLVSSFADIEDPEKIDAFLRANLIFKKDTDSALPAAESANEIAYVLPSKGSIINLLSPNYKENNDLNNVIFHLKFDKNGKTIEAKSIEAIKSTGDLVDDGAPNPDSAIKRYKEGKHEFLSRRNIEPIRPLYSQEPNTVEWLLLVTNNYIFNIDEEGLKQHYIQYEKDRKAKCESEPNCTYSQEVEDLANYRVESDKISVAFLSNRETFLTYARAINAKRIESSQIDSLVKKYFFSAE